MWLYLYGEKQHFCTFFLNLYLYRYVLFLLSAATPAQSGDAGTAVTYTLHLTNTGDVTDTFALSVAGEWTADLSAPSITLAGGGSAQFTVVVQHPRQCVGWAKRCGYGDGYLPSRWHSHGNGAIDNNGRGGTPAAP